ncbi:hypothetical protein LAZ67_2005568 [Cordylochernes scorpioides]|uniref:Reverse transcriptase n=1 Tax=Cordylochernes scorpioides TaxID=51811 RepID=A0ABY6K7S2_9ARAC|nr:hypothetical protein LAZ67_2005568 [Cordylochernes scorpioides]
MEHIIRYDDLDKIDLHIGGMKINNLHYTNDTILLAENKECLNDIIGEDKEEKLRAIGAYFKKEKKCPMRDSIPGRSGGKPTRHWYFLSSLESGRVGLSEKKEEKEFTSLKCGNGKGYSEGNEQIKGQMLQS